MEDKIVRSAYCSCCKKMAPVKQDGTFAWHDYPIMFDHYSVEGFSLGLCGMVGHQAPKEEKKKRRETH